jgi:hypothetical protein
VKIICIIKNISIYIYKGQKKKRKKKEKKRRKKEAIIGIESCWLKARKSRSFKEPEIQKPCRLGCLKAMRYKASPALHLQFST